MTETREIYETGKFDDEAFDPGQVRLRGAGLRFPDGAALDRDGSVVVSEIEGGAIVRVRTDGNLETVAEVGGGANGLAFGPDGAIYVCNSGGYTFSAGDGIRFPTGIPEGYAGGLLQRVDPATGAVETVFTESDGKRLGGLNDIVFDAAGGAYLADTTGSALHYTDPVAGTIRVAAEGLAGPNGAGLSPDGSRLYVSETYSGRVRVWDVRGPGELAELPDLYRHPGEGRIFWDGLAVDGDGNVCVTDQFGSGVLVLGPDRAARGRFVTPVPDRHVTNLCFGEGSAYVTSGGRGLLYEVPWPWPVLKLNFQP